MKRRGFLRGACAGSVAGIAGVAGCLERLGFEEQSAWRDPPLVEDRPDAVYVPAASEEMADYGRATDWEYAVSLSYTFPHRFWNVREDTVDAVPVEVDDTHHLMCDVWDVETETVLPVDMFVEIERDGELVEGFTPWPMLSQRMGFHYGDNVSLPEEGAYTARVQVGPVDARKVGAFEGRFESASTLEIEFTYERADVHDLEFETVDHDSRGTRDALPLMDHGDEHDHDGHAHGHDDPGHPPSSRAPPVDDLPGTHLGTERSADADLVVVETDDERLAGDDEAYLAVSPRTPHNGIVLPLTSLSATVSRDGEVLVEGLELRETLDEAFGHHYGAGVDALESGDEVTVEVESPPQVTRHDGYETAFLDFDAVTVTR